MFNTDINLLYVEDDPKPPGHAAYCRLCVYMSGLLPFSRTVPTFYRAYDHGVISKPINPATSPLQVERIVHRGKIWDAEDEEWKR